VPLRLCRLQGSVRHRRKSEQISISDTVTLHHTCRIGWDQLVSMPDALDFGQHNRSDTMAPNGHHEENEQVYRLQEDLR